MKEETMKTQRLQELVDKVVVDPTSFLAIMELRRYLGNLPYGTVSNDTLNALVKKLQEVSPAMALKMLEYSVNQAVYLNE